MRLARRERDHHVPGRPKLDIGIAHRLAPPGVLNVPISGIASLQASLDQAGGSSPTWD
jgi:hypothetical protein